MPLETTYTQARASFASLCNAASDDREVVIIHRRNAADVALIAAKNKVEQRVEQRGQIYLISNPVKITA